MSVTDEPVVTPDGVNVKAVRRELRLSQSQLARMIGCSIRAVQSVEQGWRHASPALEKAILLLLMAHRHAGLPQNVRCWERTHCPPERRDNCITYRTGQGHLCWFLSGTLCTHELQQWEEKRRVCFECPVLKTLLDGDPAATAPD